MLRTLREKSGIPILCFSSALCGVLGWSGDETFLPLVAIVPLLWGKTRTGTAAFWVMFAYYLAGSRGILRGSYVFFSDGDYLRAFLFWAGSATALAIPWAIMKTNSLDSFLAQIGNLAVAIGFSVIPPLGIIGWLNPFLISGLFFPRCGWFGVLAMLLIWSFLITKDIPIRYILMIALCTIVTAFTFDSWTPVSHPDFIGVNTSLGRIASGSSDPLHDYERIIEVFADLEKKNVAGELGSGVKNIVLPENICGNIRTKASREEWERGALKILGRNWQKDGRTMFLGAEFGTPEKGELKYDNCVFSVGTEHVKYKQGTPVPFSMYRPWDPDYGANAYLFKAETITLRDGTRAGFLICYEQFLSWPWILTLLAGGDIDVAICVANNWWSKDTSLPTIQARSRFLWGKLLGVPVVSAENI